MTENTGTTTDVPVLTAFTVDCADASAQAAFWAGLLGGEVTYDADGMSAVEAGGTTLYFGAVEAYAAPGWGPGGTGTTGDVPKQYHLDLRAAPGRTPGSYAARVSDLGGSTPGHQPGGERWQVYLDPAGHPFCISAAG